MIIKLILFLLASLSLFAQDFTLDSFRRELNSRQSRVEEFRFIKETATKLGIKNLYMFGGTAAAWAHYVRWDMRRELGLENLQTDRFDYDYTNVFRANQDFDLVVSGTIEQANQLEKIVQSKFNYFSGTSPTWEVRLLNEQRSDKESLLGSDFQNQHTDSHSTGLIDMLECAEYECVKDVRDMKNTDNQFILDVFEAKLHYYFSKKHKNTNRFKNKMNPEILSVIRYFTKVVQYNLKIRKNDLVILQKIINKFNPSRKMLWNQYVDRWLEKNAKKLILNAIDMEYSQRILEETGLKEKLIQLGSPHKENSMSWWINKEALKGFSVGQGDGEKAKDIYTASSDGSIILAHETNDFAAYESITKSHAGTPNVLISRKNSPGELAAYGDGHYTQVGTSGARGTGLTIRYILNPNARMGTDFTRKKNFVIIKNKNAIKIIPESIKITPIEYFEKIASGFNFDFNDKGVTEKLRRKLLRKTTLLKPKEISYIENNIVLKSPSNPTLVSEWNELIVQQIFNAQAQYNESEYFSKLLKDKRELSLKNIKSFNITGRLLGALGLLLGAATIPFYYEPELIIPSGSISRIPLALASVLGPFFGLTLLADPVHLFKKHLLRITRSPLDSFSKKIMKTFTSKFTEVKSWISYASSTQFNLHALYKINNVESFLFETTYTEDQIQIQLRPNPAKAFPLKRYQEDLKKLSKLFAKSSICELNYLKSTQGIH